MFKLGLHVFACNLQCNYMDICCLVCGLATNTQQPTIAPLTNTSGMFEYTK